MLSDLKQYFTDNIVKSLDELSQSELVFIKLMANVVPLIKNDVLYLRMIEDLQDADAFDNYFLMYLDLTYVTDHWGDIFNCLDYGGNMLTRLILATCCEHEDFDIKCIWQNGYDYHRYGEDMSLDNRFIDGYVQRWFEEELGITTNTLSDLELENNHEEDVYLEQSNIELFSEVVTFKNKSIGRRIRKAYKKNSFVRSLFSELNYIMVNGQFCSIGWYDIESYDPINYAYDVDDIIEGVEALREVIGLKYTKRDVSELERNLNILVSSLQEEESSLLHIINTIMAIQNTRKEIIL